MSARFRERLALGFLALGAQACATATPSSPRERSPLAVEPEAARPSASLVTSATAAVATATAAIDLPSVLGLAGAKPNLIRLAQERVAEADARVDASTAGLLPQLRVGGDFTRHNGIIQDVSGNFLECSKQAFFLGGTGELVLDVGGSVLGILRARQQRDAASAELESVVQERILAAATAYFELVGAESSVEIARDAVEHAKGFLDVAASREKNLVGLPLDRIRAEADVARSRQDLILAEERARVASIRLATILRLDALVTLQSSEREVRPITFVAPEAPAERLIATALEAHPDIVAAARRVAAADLEDDAARVGPFLPVLRAGVGGNGGGLGYDGPELGKLRDREDYYVGLELRFSGLGLRSERVRQDDVRESVIAGVLEAREVVRSRNAAIEVALDELKAADEARKIARVRLEQGTGIAIDVLAAEEERTRAATHVVDAIVGYNAAQYRLLARLGERPGR